MSPSPSAPPPTSAILEGMPDGFIALDPDGLWVATNAAAERLFGCARAATQGHANDDLLRDVLGTDIGMQLQRTRAAGEVVEFESFDRHRGRWLFIRLQPGADGSATIFIQDITRQKRAESNLAFLLAISDDLANCNDEAGMMRSVCEKIGAHLGLSHCGYSEINEAGNEAVVTHEWHRSDVQGLA